MKNLLLAFSFLFIVCSCSSDDPYFSDRNKDREKDRDKETTNPVHIGIQVSKKDGNIFENFQFTLYPDRDCSMLDVKETYDSIAWVVPELNGRMRVLEHTDSSSSFKFSWAHSFYSKGRYHTILKGFKDGKVVLSDTIVIHIDSKRDIMGYNWTDITKSRGGAYGTANALGNNFSIYTSEEYKDNFPALRIYFRTDVNPNDGEVWKQFCEQRQENLMKDYFTDLYGKPKLSYDKDGAEALAAYYNEHFRKVDVELVPRHIWETRTSRIVVLQSYEEYGEYHEYLGYAEPNK